MGNLFEGQVVRPQRFLRDFDADLEIADPFEIHLGDIGILDQPIPDLFGHFPQNPTRFDRHVGPGTPLALALGDDHHRIFGFFGKGLNSIHFVLDVLGQALDVFPL